MRKHIIHRKGRYKVDRKIMKYVERTNGYFDITNHKMFKKCGKMKSKVESVSSFVQIET